MDRNDRDARDRDSAQKLIEKHKSAGTFMPDFIAHCRMLNLVGLELWCVATRMPSTSIELVGTTPMHLDPNASTRRGCCRRSRGRTRGVL